MILISSYGHDVIGDLMPAFTLKPDKMYILYDHRRCRRRDIRYLSEAISGRLENVKVVSVECNSFSVKAVRSAFAMIFNENKNEIIYVDVTGGPELMTAAGCSYAKELGGIPVYIDLDSNRLYNVFDDSISYKPARIGLNDYLTAIGASQFANSHQMPLKEEYDNICEMAEYIFDNLQSWSALEKYLENMIGGEEIFDFEFDGYELKDYSKEKISGMERLLDNFCRLGFLIRHSKIDYEIPNKKYKQYLTTFGVWLELYVFINAQKYFDEVYLGFIINWEQQGLKKSNDNEIDVIVMDGCMPVFISCKTRKPEAKDVCEIGFLAQRLGGRRARSVLATTYPVKEAGEVGGSIYSRLKKFDVGLIEAKDLVKKDPAEVLKKAFRSNKDDD